MHLNTFMRSLEGIINSDSLATVFAIAEEECVRKIILHFKVSGCDPLSNANLLIMYTPYVDVVEPLRLEVRVDSNKVMAREFMNSQYNKLMNLGAQVALGKDGIYAIFKIKIEDTGNLIEFINETLNAVCRIFSSEKNLGRLNLIYDGFTLVRE